MKKLSSACRKCINQALTARKQFSSYLPLKPSEQAELNKIFINEQIFSSNHIEGNQYSLDETIFLLETGISAKGKKLKDSIEINNLSNSIKFSKKYKGKLTEKFIKELHKRVVAGLFEDPDLAGNYKKERNWVGNINTSTPQATPVHMKDLVKWFNTSLEEISNLPQTERDIQLLYLASEFKLRFICIHPFTDGNGRVSRLLFNFILSSNGFIDISILPEDKQDYYSALKSSTVNMKENKYDSEPLCKFMCRCLVKQYARLMGKLG